MSDLLAATPLGRGDGDVPERAAGDLSQLAIQARTLSVHTQASQRLRGSFPAAAPSRGPRHRPGSNLLHRYVHKGAAHVPPVSVLVLSSEAASVGLHQDQILPRAP